MYGSADKHVLGGSSAFPPQAFSSSPQITNALEHPSRVRASVVPGGNHGKLGRMEVREQVSLSELTTLRVGGPARRLITAQTTDEVVEVEIGRASCRERV